MLLQTSTRLAEERTLGVVKVAAFRLDGPAGPAGIFLLPFDLNRIAPVEM
jgi:hypothetical protein